MPHDGSLTPRDLADKLDVLVVACPKCDRENRYAVRRLIEGGRAGTILDWLDAHGRLPAQARRERQPKVV